MPKMGGIEMQRYLAEPRIADLVTLHEDGSPHVAPVWYQHHSGTLIVMAHASSVKVRNIQQDPRVAISIPKPDYPYQYVVMEGTAKITDRDTVGPIMDISIHYRGAKDGETFGREVLEAGGTVIIEISPSRMITWTENQ